MKRCGGEIKIYKRNYNVTSTVPSNLRAKKVADQAGSFHIKLQEKNENYTKNVQDVCRWYWK